MAAAAERLPAADLREALALRSRTYSTKRHDETAEPARTLRMVATRPSAPSLVPVFTMAVPSG